MDQVKDTIDVMTLLLNQIRIVWRVRDHAAEAAIARKA